MENLSSFDSLFFSLKMKFSIFENNIQNVIIFILGIHYYS